MKFVAFERKLQGTGASRRLRNSGKTPAIVYGGSSAPQLIELDHNPLWFALKKEAFHASILEMELNGVVSKVLLRNVMYHAFRPQVQHLDFQRVEADTVLTMKVPLHYSGQENSPAVKTDSCLVTHVVNDIQVSCLPADLPEFIAVDLSNLKKGASLHLSDVAMPKGVKALSHGKKSPVLVTVTAPREEEVVAPVAAAAGKKDAKKKK